MVAAVSASALLAACSGAETGGSSTASPPDDTVVTTSSADPFTTGEDRDVPLDGPVTTGGSAATTDVAPTTAEPVVESIEPVPETGVPGIDSADDFCRAWSVFAGSYQALALAAGTADPVTAARLEVVANDAIRTGASGLAALLPAELDDDRSAITETLTSPILRRADRARDLLATAGVDGEANARLADAWLDALAEQGLQTGDPTVTIDDRELDVAVREAAVALVDELPPIVEDPSLVVDVDLSGLESYLFDNCPDRGTLTGNDRTEG